MMIKAAILLFLIGMIQVFASPVDGNLIVPDTEEATVYGKAAGSTRHLTSDAGTLSNFVVCSTRHTADINSCRELITSLIRDGNRTLAHSPRNICLSQSGEKCCVSWSKPAPGLQKIDLVNSANKVLNQCNTGTLISGLERGVNLHGAIDVTQCMSDRETGCR